MMLQLEHVDVVEFLGAVESALASPQQRLGFLLALKECIVRHCLGRVDSRQPALLQSHIHASSPVNFSFGLRLTFSRNG